MPQPNRGGHAAAPTAAPIKGGGSKPSAAGDKNLPKPVKSSGIKGSGTK